MTTVQDGRGLHPLGELIFYDRYAQKTRLWTELGQGQLVVVCPDPRTGQRELARVSELRPDHVVQVELQDGFSVDYPADQIDVPVETFEGSKHRIAFAVAAPDSSRPLGAQASYELFREILSPGGSLPRFVPAGRIWAGAGIDEKLTPFNCYVLPTPTDSRHGIVETLDRMLEIMSRGGGVGIPVHGLRPQRALVRGVNGRSSGATLWSQLYSFGTGLIEQGGSRRGALMLIQYVWHPDVLSFITAKRTAGVLENANLSIGVTDAFMEAVQADASWELIFPETSHPTYDETWGGDIEAWKAAGKPVKVYATLPARELWRKIIDSAWASAEPGLFFADRYNKLSNSYYYSRGLIFCTNPCFTGDTRIATQYGMVPIGELADRQLPLRVTTDTRVESEYGVGEKLGVALRDAVPAFQTSAAAEVFQVETRKGYRVRATAYHKFVAPRGFAELREFQPGDELLLQSAEGQWGSEGSEALGAVLGWMTGDGWWSGGAAVLRFYGEKKSLTDDLLALGRQLLPEGYTLNSYTCGSVDALEASSEALARVLAEYRFTADTKGRIPEVVWRGTRETARAYLRYLFAADGQVNHAVERKSCSARYSQSDPELLREVQLLLLNLGIVSALYPREPEGLRSLPDGKGGVKDYTCKASYDLAIAKTNLARFAEIVGFARPEHAARYRAFAEGRVREPYRETFVDEIVSITATGIEPVYCTTQPSHHTIIANGVVTGQCGEQGLPPWGVCNLGHLNLPTFLVGKGIHEAATLDYDLLRRTIHAAVRFMDNLIDVAFMPFEENRRQQSGERRVGLGTMGLGELLIRMHIPYDSSDECLGFLDKLYRFIAEEAYMASTELAAEKGSFPWFEAEKFLASGFMRAMPERVREAVRQKGLRNVTLLTQAPTGTVGTMMGTSTGIEPFFAWEWERKGRLGKHAESVGVYAEYLLAHPEVAERRQELAAAADTIAYNKALADGASQGEAASAGKSARALFLAQKADWLPHWFRSSYDLTPDDHARTQAAIQRWTDSSISKTSNLPAHYTPEKVGAYYELLHSLGCKGGTVYRDGSRSEQVLTAGAAVPASAPAATALSPEPEAELNLLDVPKEGYEARVWPLQTPLGKLSVKLGIHPATKDIFEAWIDLSKGGTDVAAFTEALARVISVALRIPSKMTPSRRLEVIASQLEGIGGSDPWGFGVNRVLSVPDGVGKALRGIAKSFYARGEDPVVHALAPSHGADVCPSCHQTTLRRSEGCFSCPCGYSKC